MRKHPAASSLLLSALLLLALLPGSTGISLAQTLQADYPRSVQAETTTTRVSVASDGTEGDDGSCNSSLSADGRYVAFQSKASNLVPGDTNGILDVFVHDRQTGETTRVSVASDGTQANYWVYAETTSLSADGRYVAFDSEATTLVPQDTNGAADIFVHDRQTGQTTRVSVASDGTQANRVSLEPSLSADGRYVTFDSTASNLVAGDTNGTWDIFVHDRQTGQTIRVSVASDGTQANSESHNPSFSADGRYVAFDSYASNLVPGDTNEKSDIFVHDQQTGQTTRVSVAPDGTQADRGSLWPSLSADGRYVAFDSFATNLVAGDTNGTSDVFVHDRHTGQTMRVSVASDGTQANGLSWYSPPLSAGGRYVAFQSEASNLVPGDTNEKSDIFVHDRETGQTTRASVAFDGTQGNAASGRPSLSADGQYVAFESWASNLVVGDTNGTGDVFVHERPTPVSEMSIAHIEVTQVIQDEQNDVPLIASKPTFVRVYVDCGEGCTSVPNVTGALEVSSDAGSGAFTPNMGSITAYHPDSWVDQRGSLERTLNFYTIPSTLLTGTVALTATVGSATFAETVSFDPGNRLRIAWVPILYQPNAPDPPTFRPDPAITYRAWFYMSKIYPIATYDLDYFYQPVQPADRLVSSSEFTPDRAWNEYLRLLQGFWNVTTHLDGWRGGQPDRLFGWIPEQAQVSIDGMAYANWPGTNPPWPGTGQVAAGIANQRAERTLAHEIGHLLRVNELLHAPCRTTAWDPLYPNQEGLIDDWGIDFLGRAPELQSPETVKDFMSYCWPSWTSKHHYRKLVTGFQDFADLGTESATESQPVLVVSGEVLTPSLDVSFGAFYPLTSEKAPDENRGTDYCLELRDDSEYVLDSRCFDLGFIEPEGEQPLDSEFFPTTLPYPPGTHAVVLAHLGNELGRATKSDHAPSVELVYPEGGELWDSTGTYTVTWVADDVDGDPLSFIVSYSIDDGVTWMPIALDVTTNFLAVESQYLPGSANARLKVMATDQMNSTSDSSDAPFAVGSKNPEVFILSPEQDNTIPFGVPILLQGHAYDLEDGRLVGASLEWFSNLDGELGAGDSVIASLSFGQHEVTLSAADSDGNIVFHSIDLYVGHKIYLPLVSK
jgi:Tol biopolymer transport system component